MAGRPLSKSRYRLGLECPTKIYYSLYSDTYLNRNKDNDFLNALAEGGFQVGELARCMHEPGHLIDTLVEEDALNKTSELLKQDKVTIFEAAFAAKDCSIRADIIRKQGKNIDLIEVKSKGVELDAEEIFTGKRGLIKPAWLPYLHDVAFQTWVLSAAMPGYDVRPHLMLVDKSSLAPIDGLNGYFILRKDKSGSISAKMTRSLPQEAIEQPVLCTLDVSDLVEQIVNDSYDGMTFVERVTEWAAASKAGRKIASPITGSKCSKCEFRASAKERAAGKRSGFHECWTEQTGLAEQELDGPLVTEIWNSRQKDNWTEACIYRVQDLDPSCINDSKNSTTGWSQSDRQKIQVRSVQKQKSEPVVDDEGLKAALSQWRYPLHFIDFETTRSALPFHKGQRPYGLAAFQFSHHMVESPCGPIRHAGEWICLDRGTSPNEAFAHALREEIGNDEGTVLHYAQHERTVLSELADEVNPDTSSWISQLLSDSAGRMVDMQKILLAHYYHPLSRGSNSLKAILPAVLRTSRHLQQKYSSPIYGTDAMPSKNFRNHTWLTTQNGMELDPYQALPRLDGEERNERIFSDQQIKNGGGAMTAYARCQFTEMSDKEREAVRVALLKYCELDTLAMMMLWEEWMAVACEDTRR